MVASDLHANAVVVATLILVMKVVLISPIISRDINQECITIGGITMKLLGNLLRLGKDNMPLVLELYGTREFLGKILIQVKKILELRKKIYTNDRNKKVSNALKVICSTDEHREMMHERMQGLIMNRKFSISSNMELTFIDEAIKPLGIEFERQHYIKDIRQYCDIYIPSKKTIVEFNGDFWHANPLTYDRNSLRYKS